MRRELAGRRLAEGRDFKANGCEVETMGKESHRLYITFASF
jgi:hypothetical protein